MSRLLLFAFSLSLVVAHVTGNMPTVLGWFNLRTEQWLYLVAVPFVGLTALTLLRDKA